MIRDAASGGGYICWTGCDWPLDVPLANVDAFYNTAKKIRPVSDQCSE
ncbi:MAG: hypothetical protein WCQ63_04600 [Methanomethylophilus sp.]